MKQLSEIDAAMSEYSACRKPVIAIAKKHGVTPSTLTMWAKKRGLPVRGRGRWRRETPPLQHKQIIQLAKSLTYREVGAQFGVTRQRINQILRRWGSTRSAKEKSDQES